MTDLTLAGVEGIIGHGIIQALGGSIILLAIVIVLIITLIMWRLKATMQETYFVCFIALGVLRLWANDQSFNDVGVFGLLHNLLILGSAIVWAKILTSEHER